MVYYLTMQFLGGTVFIKTAFYLPADGCLHGAVCGADFCRGNEEIG